MISKQYRTFSVLVTVIIKPPLIEGGDGERSKSLTTEECKYCYNSHVAGRLTPAALFAAAVLSASAC